MTERKVHYFKILIKDLKHTRFLKVFLIIWLVQAVWLSSYSFETANMWDSFYTFVNSVYVFILVFVFGLLFFVEKNLKRGKVSLFINVRINHTIDKIIYNFLYSSALAIFYAILFFLILIMFLILQKGFSLDWSLYTQSNRNFNTEFFTAISPVNGFILILIRHIMIAILIGSLNILLEVLFKKLKIVIMFLFLILCACYNFSKVPILSVFYIGINNDFLLAGNHNILAGFCRDNIYLFLMIFVYLGMAAAFSQKADMEIL